MDLDPALTGTEFGQAPAGTGRAFDDPVAAHQVRFTLTIERLKDGKLRQSDARVAFSGNGRRWLPRPGDGVSRSGIANIDGGFVDNILDGPDGAARDIVEKALEDLAEIERKEKAARGKRGSGGNEYVIVLFNVSIPASTAAGVAVGSAVLIGLLYALFG